MVELPTGTVTFLFTDIEGSTRLWEQHPEAMRLALARHDALLTQGIQQHGGSVVKSRGEGDSFFAVFPGATDALEAACRLQQTLLAEPWPAEMSLRVRLALHTGEAELRESDYFGAAVNRCSRLRAAAHGGQVLLTLATQELVRDSLPEGLSPKDLGEHRLKDLARPERVFQLLHPALPGEFPPLRTLDARPNNLPAQPTPLVGRERELEQARELLLRPEVRHLTLTGPGGTGKTRLGFQIAADRIEAFADGVFFIALAPITDSALVASAVAQALSVRETPGQSLLESLKEYLREKQLLLLLDNFEQVLAAAPLVAELLSAAPGLKVLVTSRATLRLRGEHELAVPPLALPDPKRLPAVAALSQYAAVELFIQRALAVKADFAVTNENAPAVAQICCQLDGLPLAIELAAARIRLLPPQALLTRLESRLKLLTGGARDLPERQQTLRGAIAWSYDLLTQAEKTLFRRLSVFVGGCTLEAAEAICNANSDLEIDLLDGLESLVGQSLLRQEESAEGEPRFGMFETIREYGLDRLSESGEEASIRHGHAQYFLELAERERDRWERLQGERDNLRTALGWLLERGEGEPGFRFAEALIWFWARCGPVSEAAGYLAKLLGLLQTPSLREARSHTLDSAAMLAYLQGDWAAARASYEESLTLCQELGQTDRAASRHVQLGRIAREQGDYERARTHYELSLVIARELGNQNLVARTLHDLGWMARSMNDLARASEFLRESLAASRELGHKGWLAQVLVNLAIVTNALGDRKTVGALLEESLAISRVDEDETAIISMDQGHLLLEWGDYAAAWSRFEEGLAARRANRDNSFVACALLEAGHAAWLQGEDAVTQSYAVEALRLFQELASKPGILAALENLAVAALAQGRKERAAQLAGAAAALREGLRLSGPDWWLRPKERIDEAVRATFLGREFAAAWAEGEAMSLQQAIEVALGEGTEA